MNERIFGQLYGAGIIEPAHVEAIDSLLEQPVHQPGGAFIWTPEELEQLERSAAYLGLYALAAAVDAWLVNNHGHLRDCRGRAITHFDEWLRAAEAGEWVNG